MVENAGSAEQSPRGKIQGVDQHAARGETTADNQSKGSVSSESMSLARAGPKAC